MTIEVVETELWTHECPLRIPFSFGVTTLHELPQVFLTVTVDVNGMTQRGVASEHLVPRWFSKDLDKTPAEDIATLKSSIRQACEHATLQGPDKTLFSLWQTLYERQRSWGDDVYPALVWGLGVSLVERGVIDAFCRISDNTFAEAVREKAFGVRPGAIYDELAGADLIEYLPEEPRSSVAVRHTVGFDDPLTAADIDQGTAPDKGSPVDDALPHTLKEVIDSYEISHFKIKMLGDPVADKQRIRDIVGLVGKHVEDPLYTLDANEQYETLSDFQEFWGLVTEDRDLSEFQEDLSFIEQPFPREIALNTEIGDSLSTWSGPPIIIDESDDRPDALGRALNCGYAGTSHKNCKGVFKSLVNACLLERRRRENGAEYVFSGEDLTTIGPVALPQDLAVVATLGIGHVERNGHHYLRGLDGFPQSVQEKALNQCSDLYHRQNGGFPTLTIEGGSIDIETVNRAPFGVNCLLDRADFD